jgi:hypothetical protein
VQADAESFMLHLLQMVCYVIPTPDPLQRSTVEELVRLLEREQIGVTLIDADSPMGSGFCVLYEINSRPAVVVTRDDGQLANSWVGELPPFSEVAYLVRS